MIDTSFVPNCKEKLTFQAEKNDQKIKKIKNLFKNVS